MNSAPRTVLGIAASPRASGNSTILLDEVLGRLAPTAVGERIRLAEFRLLPCDGCHACEAQGYCRLDDDLGGLWPRLLAADAVLIASPVYMGGVASRLQVFMERCWPLRKGQMAGKLGAHIVTGRRRIGVAPQVIDAFFDRLGVIVLPGVIGYAFAEGGISVDDEARDGARRLARALTDLLPSLHLQPARSLL